MSSSFDSSVLRTAPNQSSPLVTSSSHSSRLPAPSVELSPVELLQLVEADPKFYAKYFFPRTARQDFPEFEDEIWNTLESGQHRLVNMQIFRGGAKTTKARLFASRRISFGISRTILYVGKSEGHATRSVRWLRRHIEQNKKWADFFGLRPGKKWSDVEIEIVHDKLGISIYLIGMGITGSIRGINFDDYRPDLIVVDDMYNEESAESPEQRRKIERVFYGGIVQSLAPKSEAPEAMIALLATPLDQQDVTCRAEKDPAWKTLKFPVLNARGESSWKSRWPTETVLAEKDSFRVQNRLSLWLAEMMLQLVSPETNAFKPEWIRTFDQRPPRSEIVIAIDPVPPPSERELARGLAGKDYEAFAVVQRWKGKYYILETSTNRGHEPDWTVTEFFRLCEKYKPRCVLVEAIQYQRTLGWILRQAMQKERRYFVVEEFTDQRKKYQRIVDALSGPGANGNLLYDARCGEFQEQFESYPNVTHDDVIDAVSVAVTRLAGRMAFADGEEGVDEIEPLDSLDLIPDRSNWRVAV